MSKKDIKYNWDLSKIFENDKEFDKAVKKAYELVDKAQDYKGKILKDSKTFYRFLSDSIEADRLIEKIYVYAGLAKYSDGLGKSTSEKYLKSINLYDYRSESLSFIRSELLSSSNSKINKYLDDNKKYKKYKFYFEKLFRYKKYTLSEKEESIISKASSAFGTSKDSYHALNDNDALFGYIKNSNGEKTELTQANYISFMKNSNRKVRMDAFNTYYKFYDEHINTISNLYLGQIKESFFASKVRKFESPLVMSMFYDNLNAQLFNNLIKVTNKNLDMLHEYLDLKRRSLGVKQLHMYDIYAGFTTKSENKISYEKGIKLLFKALKPLGEQYLSDFELILNSRNVDVYPKKGKRSGAFQWSSYDSEPYVLLNYVDDISSVSTLAHEMGHAMHSYYSNKKQDYIYADYPIFLAEIASTVNEILFSEYMIKNSKDEAKAEFLEEFLEKIRATIYRQVMFSEFERDCFNKFDSGLSLTKDELCNSYLDLNKKYFGNKVVSDDYIKYEWARIPHFYTPFYVYKYATGFTCAIIIASKLLSGEKGFKEKYISFLSSGCSKYPLDIIKELGINLEDEKTLQIGFDYFKDKLELLKKLLEEE